MMPTVVKEQAPIPPPSYQRAQARLGPALHIDALTLVTTLRLLTLCRLAVGLAHRRCPPPLPAGPGGAPLTYREESLLLISLLRTLWRLSYQDMHDWLKSWPALALACGLPLNKEGQPRIPSKSQQCKRRHRAGAPLHESLFVLTVLQAIQRRLSGARDLIIDSAPILAWRRRDPDATFGHAPAHHPRSLLLGYRVHTLICRGSGLPLFFLLSPAHDAPFAQPLLAWARGSTKFVPVSFAWMRPIGACASLPGFMACLERWLSFLGIPSVRKTAPVYLPPGRKKNSANAAASSASLDAFSSSFSSNALPYVAGPRLLHRSP
jgi:hypothetical protein